MRVLCLAAVMVALCGAALAAEDGSRRLVEPDPLIRVLLTDSASSLVVCAQPEWRVVDSSGSVLARLEAGRDMVVSVEEGRMTLAPLPAGDGGVVTLGAEPVTFESEASSAALEIRRIPYGVGWSWESLQDRVYEGRIEMRLTDDGAADRLSAICILPMEKYLRGVVPSEIGANSPHEALCAQAVAARSAAVLALTEGLYSGPHHDICSDVACQVFSGLTRATKASDAGISATRGLVMMFEGKPVSAYYASNCGGHAEDIRNVWPDRAHDRAYWDGAGFDADSTAGLDLDLTTDEGLRQWIEASPPTFCNPAFSELPQWTHRNFRWTREFAAEDVTTMVARTHPGLGRITAIRPVKRGVSGRLSQAEFVGETGSVRIGPELAIRQMFQPPLRGAGFIVEPRGGSAERPEEFVIRGAGWGHGVGMCQTGAIGMANAGRHHREILQHYYRNTKLETLY